VEIRRAAEQFVTERDGVTTVHCLSFGDHYDPDRVSIGPLVALNDERVPPLGGYPTHPHRGLDILTWVVEGALRHESSLEVTATIRPGTTQRLTAGSGVTHSETNASGTEPLRFLQLWFSIEDDVAASYESWTLPGDRSGWFRIADDMGGEGLVRLAAPGVSVWVGRFEPGEHSVLPSAGTAVAYVARGDLEVADTGTLVGQADSVRTDDDLALTARTHALVLAVSVRSADPGR
jgi:hypothetical protein